MRRYVLHFLVGLLTFEIGLFVAIKFYQPPTEQTVIIAPVENVENISNVELKKEEIKYGCEETRLESFWEKLNKKAFLRFKKQQLKEFYNDLPGYYEQEWKKISENFSCSYFGDLKEIDLNNDGKSEYLLSGECGGREGCETFIFEKTENELEMILFDVCNIEHEIKSSRSDGFNDIAMMTNWDGLGNRYITVYEFNKSKYKARKCYSEEHNIEKNGEMIEVDDAVVTRTACN